MIWCLVAWFLRGRTTGSVLVTGRRPLQDGNLLRKPSSYRGASVWSVHPLRNGLLPGRRLLLESGPYWTGRGSFRAPKFPGACLGDYERQGPVA